MTISKTVRLDSLIAPIFHDLHKDVWPHRYTHYILEGGRGSSKSSFVSIEAVLILLRYSDINVLVLRKVANTLRDTVFPQYLWAIEKLQVAHLFTVRVAPISNWQRYLYPCLTKYPKTLLKPQFWPGHPRWPQLAPLPMN